MTYSSFALFAAMTVAEFLATMLQVATAVGLPVTSWRTGDPTLVLMQWLAEQLQTRDQAAAELAKGAWLSTAENGYETLVADEVYGVEREGATYAAPTVTITNTGGGVYNLAAGELRVKATSINKTFHSADPVTFSPGDTATVNLLADEPGSDSSVVEDEIDDFVAPALLGLEIQSSTAAVARDEQSAAALKEQCLSSLAALSPNGPDDAYEYVATRRILTGVEDVAFAYADGNSTTGAVVVYVAGPSGPVAGSSKTAVLSAITTWATPKGHTPVVDDATPVNQNITAVAYGVLPSDGLDRIEAALGALLSNLRISDGTIYVSRSALDAAAHAAVPELTRLVISTPASDVLLALGAKVYPGTIAITEG